MITIGILSGLGVILLGLVGLSLASRRAPTVGLQDGRLRPCPGTPNCLCTDTGQAGSITALPVSDPAADWARAQRIVEALGGRIRAVEGEWLHATFTTPVLRFVDDLELRLDRDAGLLQLRSASRVGHSDLGANRRRLQAFVARWNGATRP